MPLPKSSSIAAKATEVYTEIWSVLLQQIWNMSPTREGDLCDLSRLLPYLRQLLTCCACAGLLEDAMISLPCGHCYCCQCQFKDPLLKIQCRQCRDRNGLVVEAQLRIVVECYKHMCYILVEKVDSDPMLLKTLSAQEQSEEEDIEKTSSVDENVENLSNDKSKKSKQKSPLQNANGNPIVEILREIHEGVKVSRSILVIKPPQKYLTPRVATPRKDQLTSLAYSSVSKPKCAVDLSSELSSQERNTPTYRQKRSPRKPSLISHRISSLRGKRKRRNILGTRSLQSTPSGETVPKRRRTIQRLSDIKRIGEDEEVDILSLSESKPQGSELDILRSKLALDKFDQDFYSVSLSCLDDNFLQSSPDGISLKQSCEQDVFRYSIDYDPDHLSFKQSKDGSRERLWSHMCPRVKARRSMAIINKTITQEVMVALGEIKTKSKEMKAKSKTKSKEIKMKSKDIKTKSKDIKTLKPKKPEATPSVPFTPPPPPTPTAIYEPPLPDDLSGLVLEKLEGEDPLPYIDRLLFRPPPMYHPPPHFHPLPPPPHFGPGGSPMFGPMPHPGPRYPLMMPSVSPLKPPHFPLIPKTPTKSPSTPRKRRTPGYSEDGWRCRCGTNNVMFPEKVCAKGKCPCFSKGIPCKNCLCKHCHNPNNKT